MEFNRIIKLLRKERGITQKQAAEDLGVSQALLSHYEKGIRECGLDFVVRVADYYNVSCDYLLGRSAERNGMMLSAEDIPNPDKMKDNIYHGSVLPTMNKKLISNSLNVLYAKIGECHSKALTTEVSSYLMMAVAKMFRLLYSAESHNAPSMFSVDARRWPGYSDAVMHSAQANVEALLAGENVGIVLPAVVLVVTHCVAHDRRTREVGLVGVVYTVVLTMGYSWQAVYSQPAQSGQDQRDPRPGTDRRGPHLSLCETSVNSAVFCLHLRAKDVINKIEHFHRTS